MPRPESLIEAVIYDGQSGPVALSAVRQASVWSMPPRGVDRRPAG